ncbi:putative nitrate reductase [NADH] [Wickerhamomyces ciferrii]|uniref:Nitrate reductase [NADH] n=1 Tax=Wickerhamomyces ciferrii (strain ATCC 14091 / BCRC 22168 / CBS 111 / JCM 3599 / NBRC 0793 / NRRL Y-1031 F-60-10) TaxID=1206466 RepID=K0KZB8_WICCF|nr:putative nitrate reductase [NADH] [Wickerhamomyces ciferrii]CCH46478.1 putative nitrate reductase [NADH] [Wickerhamomyces ciferrii]
MSHKPQDDTLIQRNHTKKHKKTRLFSKNQDPTKNYYTLSEIATHDSNNDLWMIIHGKIYDVTSIIDEHPGGAEVLFECGGIDASEPFDDVGHSQDSVRMLKPLFVGYVKQDKLDMVDHSDDDDDYLLKHSKNLSLGESLFFKEFKKQRRKKFLNDKYFNIAMIVLAIMAGFSYLQIIKNKLDDN